jgi:hypothetical protein
MSKIGTSVHMSSAFHPQADGQSKRTNKTVGQVLQTSTAKRQTRWLEALPAVEFAINSAINVSTGAPPFDLIFGRRGNLFPSAVSSITEPPALTAWLKQQEGSWLDTRDTLIASRIRQALQHNKHRRRTSPIKEDLWVLLNSADWREKHQGGTDKLKERFEGPYRVIKVFNDGQSGTLDLPDGDKRHPTLQISKLKPYRTGEEDALVKPQK